MQNAGRCITSWYRAMWLFAFFSPRSPEFEIGPVRVRFMAEKVTLEQVSEYLGFVLLVTFVPRMRPTYSFIHISPTLCN